ncbi:MAG: sulfur carrier protein ThiS [Desulfobacter sp.]|nr:sulfur carrier protein ThiS [Desulfobacter sp.]WDP84455.1 MAG: sulfur carrier protein ThiS [Desulfobacter sp.]
MKIVFNGADLDTDIPDLAALVTDMGLDPSSLVIEHNFNVVKHDCWAHIPIQDGDVVELLNFVGGG